MNSTDTPIPQMMPWYDEAEQREIISYMKSGGFFTEYKKTEEFEAEIAKFTGSKFCVVVSNGTVSLSMAALALGIERGDEVIVPNYTMIATPNSLKLIGAVPVFVDVEPETLILDIKKVESAITSKTKALMLVSANGRTPKVGIAPFLALAKEKGLWIIEDAAQSLGSFYPEGCHVGRYGSIGSFSFSTPKIISTGQGGALITDDRNLYKKIKALKDFGRDGGGLDVHATIGFNFKFTDLQACIGLVQMRKLEERIILKKKIWELYKKNLTNIKNISLFDHDLNYCAPWFIDCKAENRDKLKVYLRDKGIETRVMYPSISHQEAYNTGGIFPVSEEIAANGLWLPSMAQITEEQINYVCRSIRNFYESKQKG